MKYLKSYKVFESILNVVATEGEFKLVKTTRWGGMSTLAIYQGDKEIGQYPPNLLPNIGIERFKKDFANGEMQEKCQIDTTTACCLLSH